jgi:aryl-alcohol dehydrogenase-like predicted oxidoreductase
MVEVVYSQKTSDNNNRIAPFHVTIPIGIIQHTEKSSISQSISHGVSAFSATLAPTATTSGLRSPLADEENGNVYNKIVKNVDCPGLKRGMDFVKLGGDSDLVVSKVCMGTMTYGIQNTLEEGVALLDKAFDDYGINFLDTAEIYPVPPNAKTQGDTDRCVCEFLKKRDRKEIILATKVAGRSPMMKYLPRGENSNPEEGADLTRQQILDSVDESLERLGTDYIDLLQLHWPGRYAGGLFGSEDFKPSEYEEQFKKQPPVALKEQLAALKELIDAGKVRYFGVSNETPYGICAMAALSDHFPELYPKCVSIQNSYSLVVRKDYEAGNAEACYHHDVSLLPYSPLASGTLSGKYRKGLSNDDNEGIKPRLTRYPGYMARYLGSENEGAVNAYCDLAEKYDMSPSGLALSWCYHNELVASTIIGATTMEQLEENLKAYDLRLDEVEMEDSTMDEEISKIYKRYTDPTKAKNDPPKKDSTKG